MFKINKSKLLSVSLVILLLTLTACQAAPTQTVATPTSATAELKPIGIAIFNPVLGNNYTDAVTRGVKDAAAKLGGEVTIDVFGAEYDAVKQNNQIADAIISKKYDAFIIYAVDGNAVIPAVNDAVAAGIKVVSADVPIGPDPRTLDPCCGMTAQVGLTGYKHGTTLGKMIVQACEVSVGAGKACNVGYVNGVQALTIDQERVAGIQDTLAKYPDITIVSMQDGSYLRDMGYSVAQNMLQANPDINVFATPGDQMMLGVEQAVIDAGKQGKIVLNGNGGSEPGLQAVKEGRWYATFANLPYSVGYKASEIAINALRGESVVKSIDAGEMVPPLPPGSGGIITKDNVDQFTAEYKE